jgi:hypothetical protein
MRKGIKFGIIAGIVFVVGASGFYLAEIDEPLPQGADLPLSSSSSSSEEFREFVAMSEEDRIEAGSQMTEREKNQIMLDFSKINNSIDESMEQFVRSSEEQSSQTGNDTGSMLLTGSFVGVGDGIYDAHGDAKVVPVESAGPVLRLEDLIVTNGPDLYVYLATNRSGSDFVNLGGLKANIGNQNYAIPTGTDMTKYDTFLIWCRAFCVLFGSTELKSAR